MEAANIHSDLNTRRIRLRTGLPAALAVTALIAIGGCGTDEGGEAESISDIHAREGVPVRTVTMQRRTLRSIERGGGTVRGYYQTGLSASVPGRISRINARVGKRVKRNAVLVRIDPDIASPVEMAKAQYDVARKSLERVEELAEEGGVSQEVIDQARAGYTAAREQYQGARKSQNLLAPFSGTVIAVSRTINEVIGPGGPPIVEIATLDSVRIGLSINEALVGRLAAGQQALALAGSDTIRGRVEKVAMSGSERSRAFEVETVFPNPEEKLKPGMFMSVDIVVQQRDSAIGIPMETVIREGDETFVYRVVEGKAAKTPIEPGMRCGECFEVVAGLDEGDAVVTQGASLLEDGVTVRKID